MQDYGFVSITPPTWHVQRFINLFINPFTNVNINAAKQNHG